MVSSAAVGGGKFVRAISREVSLGGEEEQMRKRAYGFKARDQTWEKLGPY